MYTEEGNWDIVGNNIPVFFIQGRKPCGMAPLFPRIYTNSNTQML